MTLAVALQNVYTESSVNLCSASYKFPKRRDHYHENERPLKSTLFFCVVFSQEVIISYVLTIKGVGRELKGL